MTKQPENLDEIRKNILHLQRAAQRVENREIDQSSKTWARRAACVLGSGGGEVGWWWLAQSEPYKGGRCVGEDFRGTMKW